MKTLTNFITEASVDDNINAIKQALNELGEISSDDSATKEDKAQARSRIQSLRDYLDSHRPDAKNILKKFIQEKYKGDAKHVPQIVGALRRIAVKHGCWSEFLKFLENDTHISELTLNKEIDIIKELSELDPSIPQQFWHNVAKEQFSGEPVIGPGELLLSLAFDTKMHTETNSDQQKITVTGDIKVGNRNIEIKTPGKTNAKIGNAQFKESGRIWDLFGVKPSFNGKKNIGKTSVKDFVELYKKDKNIITVDNFTKIFDGLLDDQNLINTFVKELTTLLDNYKNSLEDTDKFLKMWMCLYIIMYARNRKFNCLGLQYTRTSLSRYIFWDIKEDVDTFNTLLKASNIYCDQIRDTGIVQICIK